MSDDGGGSGGGGGDLGGPAPSGDAGGDSGGGGGASGGDTGNGGAADSGGSHANNGDFGAAGAATTITNDNNEMNAPYVVDTSKGGHDNDMGKSLDNRPPDLLYENQKFATSSPLQPRIHAQNPFLQRHSSLDLDDYFTGPRDTQKHSKWPLFLQMHGSILPKMLLPLLAVGIWATSVTCVSTFTKINLGISSILLTVTGFVVGLGLSFRSSTAYERYAEGRRYWAQLILACQALGRLYWVHAVERKDFKEKDILAKLTAMNLLVAFSVALKHKLRFEPYTSYEDLVNLVSHLDTFANEATIKDADKAKPRKPHIFKLAMEYLGVSFVASNPRKAIKRAGHPLGNLPLEILTYLACFTDELVSNNQLLIPMHQTIAYNNIAVLNDVMMGTERVLTTPLPIAYSIAISQITWVYVFLLPFQLYSTLKWVTIPATLVASYIILGILFIGREIENPFGNDVNDLPLESYCAQVAAELDIIASRKKHRNRNWIETLDNKVLFPLSLSGWQVWKQRGEAKVREALRLKTEIGSEARKRMMGQEKKNHVNPADPVAVAEAQRADEEATIGMDQHQVNGEKKSSSSTNRSKSVNTKKVAEDAELEGAVHSGPAVAFEPTEAS